MDIIMDNTLAVCGLIIAVGGAAVYIKKAISRLLQPLTKLEKELEDIREQDKTNKEYFANDMERLDSHDEILKETKADNRIMMESIALLLSHAETGNNTGEVGEGRKRLEKYLINR